jgi:hypothetical protein
MDIKVVIESYVGENDVIPLDTIVDVIQKSEIPRNMLQAVVDALQDHHIDNLCGKRYSRNNKDFDFERCATKDQRIFITELGTIRVKAVKVRNKQSGKITTPIVKYLGMNDKQRVTNSLRMKIANLATSLTYREVQEYLSDLLNVNVSIGTIQNSIEDEGKLAKEKIAEDCKSIKLDCLLADETESHSTGAKKNLIRVTVGTKIKENSVTPINVSVNKKWSEIGEVVKKLGVTNSDTVLISDGQVDLIEAFGT